MKNNRGFSAVELLIAVDGFGIILIVATPIITEFLAEQRANNGIQTLSAAIQRARFLSSSNNRQSVITIGAATPEGRPVQIYLDDNFNYAYDDSNVIEKQSRIDLLIPNIVTIESILFGDYEDAADDSLVFMPNGVVKKPNTLPATTGNLPLIKLCAMGGNTTVHKTMTVSKFGSFNVLSEEEANAACPGP